jgi:hypothetical protein
MIGLLPFRLLWVLFGAELICESNELSLKLLRFLHIERVGRFLEPDQPPVRGMQRGRELLSKDKRSSSPIRGIENL